MKLTHEQLQMIKERKMLLSDMDSLIICQLIDEVERLKAGIWLLDDNVKLRQENEELREEIEALREVIDVLQLKDSDFNYKPEPKSILKQFTILFYNRFACQNQLWKVYAENEFRAGRAFYREHDRKSYHACIETIYEN